MVGRLSELFVILHERKNERPMYRLLFTIAASLLLFLSGFSQESETLLVRAGDTLHGSLLLPKKNPEKILVIIHPGSGPTDRNGNQAGMENNSLKMLAEALAKKDIASLRIDKRGVGASKRAMTSESELRFGDYVADLSAWTDQMKGDSRFEKVILLGHSEGSLIAMIVAGQNRNVDAYISVAGSGVPADQIIREQLSAQPEALKQEMYEMLDTLKAGHTFSPVKPMYAALFRESVQPYMISWMKYDPQEEIQKIGVPVLILNGTMDIQVGEENAEILQKARPSSELVIVADMNHVLKKADCKKLAKQLTIYKDPDAPLVKDLVKAITGFIDTHFYEN